MDDDNNKKWDEGDASRTPMTFRLFGRKRTAEGAEASTPGCLIALLSCLIFLGGIWLMIALDVAPLPAVFLALFGTLAVSLSLISLVKWLAKIRKKKNPPPPQQ